jgi:hypothetical protein
LSQTDEELDSLTKLFQRQIGDIFGQLDSVNARLGEADRSLRTLSRDTATHATRDDLEGLRLLIDDRPSAHQREGQEVVYMPQLMRVAGNFQNSLKTATKEIDALKEVLPNLVTRDDLSEVIETIMAAAQAQSSRELESTAAGRLTYKCLLCGRPTSAVTGMITDSEIARLVGEPPVSGAAKSGSDFVLVYGREGVFRAANPPQRKKMAQPLPKIAPGSPHRPQSQQSAET